MRSPPLSRVALRPVILREILPLLAACVASVGLGGCSSLETEGVPWQTPDEAGAAEAGAGGEASQADFDAALSPYGEWIDVPPYGRVWRPSDAVVGPDFVPYGSGGQWAYEDRGWAFETGWAWGWAPFHYGRWYREPARGWVWLPGSEWAPAWVDWRVGEGYIGWAPLGPRGVILGEEGYVFVGSRDFTRPGVFAYAVPREHVHVAFASTTHVEMGAGGRWSAGPPLAHVLRVTGAPVPRVRAAPVFGRGRARPGRALRRR